MIPNQLFLSLPQFTFYVRFAAVFHFFNGTYNNWYKRIHVAYFPTCKWLSSFFDLCLQVGASSTWMPKWTQGPGQLLREGRGISSSYETLLSTWPDLPLTGLGVKLLLNVRNSTALKFQTPHVWKTTFVFPMSHSFIFLYSGDAKMPVFFGMFQKIIRNAFKKCCLLGGRFAQLVRARCS